MRESVHCQVVTATDSRAVAETLADTAVAARLAASAQVAGPVRSTYRWQGEVVAAEEWRVTFRTTVTRYAELEEHIRARHNYDVPGIVCMPIVAGYAPYLEWMAAETQER
ncbi:divalent-cation tolerance protein CutA [Solwaraspora sp. WMMB335]|uniref:divalent-cation tolerance protein CutA n=1 Tax=Solwaraspora sp. WMMB335 TaxID=3404118 RepID=UPI003B9630C5